MTGIVPGIDSGNPYIFLPPTRCLYVVVAAVVVSRTVILDVGSTIGGGNLNPPGLVGMAPVANSNPLPRNNGILESCVI